MIPALLLLAQQPNQRVSSLAGNIETLSQIESKLLGNQRSLKVYLPPQYSTEKDRKFPVLYVHDGQNVFDGMTSFIPNQEWRADEAAEMLIKAKIIEPIIIVAIDNGAGARNEEFLHAKIKIGQQEVGGKADLYSQFVVEQVMPIINAKYRTKTDAANTALCGSSLGGNITTLMGANYPKVFGKLAICSPAVWVDNESLLDWLKPRLKSTPKQKIWIDCGTQESDSMVAGATRLFEAYKAGGWKEGSNLRLVIEPNADHSERAWARRMPSILTYLFPAK